MHVNHIQSHPTVPINDASELDGDDPFMSSDGFDILNNILVEPTSDAKEIRQEKKKRKKEKQWKTWTKVVIPSLLRPHLQLLHKLVSLRSMPPHEEHQCRCDGTNLRHLKVVCVSFEGMCDVPPI
jgi:hypothetical protein